MAKKINETTRFLRALNTSKRGSESLIPRAGEWVIINSKEVMVTSVSDRSWRRLTRVWYREGMYSFHVNGKVPLWRVVRI